MTSTQSTAFNSNDYETPDKIAQAMAKLVLPSDVFILEPFAGTGQIARAIYERKGIYPYMDLIEKSHSRWEKLLENNRNHYAKNVVCDDFFVTSFFDSPLNGDYDLIITNPPFDYAMQGIKRSLEILNDKPESRLLFLLPVSFFSSHGRSQEFKSLDCHIAHEHLIPGRIDYLKNGVPMSKCQKEVDGVKRFTASGKPIMMSGRQEPDAVYCVKKGKSGGNVTFLF